MNSQIIAQTEAEGKTIMVAGLGVGGASVARILRDRQALVVTVDDRKPADYRFDQVLTDDFDWSPFGCLITSPGFSPQSPFLTKAAAQGLPILSEVEFAWQTRAINPQTGQPAVWVGITGTNGKTSTTEMTSEILQAAGYQAPAVGNIGVPVSQAAQDPSNQYLVVELSSFQLHYTDDLALAGAAITNLADDHLDWHGGFENYAADKAKVYSGVSQILVYNADDPRVSAKAREATPAPSCRRVGFSLEAPQPGTIGIDQGWIVNLSPVGPQGRLAPVTDFPHLCEPDGTVYPHLLADALTALALALGLGVDCQVAVKALSSFAPGGHRIQKVASYQDPSNGKIIRFVDDSKATNAHAAAASLSSFPRKSVVWIAGGLAKGAEFSSLVSRQREVIKAAVVIGQDQSLIEEALETQAPDIPYTLIDPADKGTVMARAIQAATAYVHGGDVILLAPACASMDQFVSYADRGDQFAAQARSWIQAQGLADQEAASAATETPPAPAVSDSEDHPQA